MRRKAVAILFRFCVSILATAFFSSCATDRMLERRTADCPPVSSPAFEKTLQELTGIQLIDGNRIVELVNGEEFFPAMIAAIQNAKQSVTFENFVWRSGKVSTQFIETLSERARAGVRVHFLIDALGSFGFDKEDLQTLRSAGVEFARYNPPYPANIFCLLHRTHRKILVVDGKIGFIGGISVTDEWLWETDNPDRWRDSNYQVEGPMVARLQEIFGTNWKQTTGAILQCEKYFPRLENAGQSEAACLMSGPGEGSKNSRRVYLLSIAAAQKNIRIANSYFIPDNFARKLLIDARERGVQVEILTPARINFDFMRRASRSRWQKLLDAGAEFYEYQPTRYHLKLMIVDDVWVTAGSVNFDALSFHINDEANFVARDEEFVATQIATFEADKRLSCRVDPIEFARRSIWIKIGEHFAGLFRFIL